MTDQVEEEPSAAETKEEDAPVPEVAPVEEAVPEAAADVPPDNQDEVKHEEEVPPEPPHEEEADITPTETDGGHEEPTTEPAHVDEGTENVEPTTEAEPPHEKGAPEAAVGETEDKTEGDTGPSAVGEEHPPLETDPTAVEGGTINPEEVEGSTKVLPHAEGEAVVGEGVEGEGVDGAAPNVGVEISDTEAPPMEGGDAQIKTDAEAVAGAAEIAALTLPKSKELTELEKIEKEMAKEAAEELLVAGIGEKMPEVVCNIKGPEKLNAESFFKSLKALQQYLQPSETSPSTYVASKKIQQLVTSMRSDMTCLREFCEATQAQMETVREPIQIITDQILHSIPKAATPEEGELTPAALDAELKQKTAHSQLAKINEALLSGMKLVAQTESAVADAQMAVVEAIELARRVHAEAEQRLKDEMEAKRLAIEAEKAEIARKKHEEEMKIAQALIDAEMLKKRAETAGKEIKPVVLPIEPTYEFDNGIGCIFYSELLSEKMVTCTSVELGEAEFEFNDNEELISHIIRFEPVNELTTIRSNLKLSIPHGLTRQQAAIREVFIKMQLVHPDGPWKELVTNDVAIEGFRDVKFAEVNDIKAFATFAVVSRFKLDLIKLKKRGGTSASKIDERVEFIYDPGSFNVREKVILQMQPVDSGTITELKRSLDVAKGLLCSTAIFRTTWRNTNFESPVTVAMILPPNPVAARKLAAERMAKDGKRSKTLLTIGEDGEETGKKKGGGKAAVEPTEFQSLEEIVVNKAEEGEVHTEALPGEEQLDQPGEVQEVVEHVVAEGEQLDQETADEKAFAESHKKKKSKKDEESEERKALWRTPVKWYMGKYGKDVEDERDQLFLVRQNAKKGRWTIEPYRIDVGKFDKIFVELQEPIEVFAVFRVSMSVMERDVERIADALEALLTRRLVRFIVKQQFNDPCEVIACIVPILRMERVLKRLQDDEYSDGPEMSDEFLLKDGDCLSLVFRGNIVCEDSTSALTTVFTTNLDTKFKLRINANDVYVQKSYDVYRGFVQLRRVYQVLIKPEEPKKKDAKQIAAEKAIAAFTAKKALEDAEMSGETVPVPAEEAGATKVDTPEAAAEDAKATPVAADAATKSEENKTATAVNPQAPPEVDEAPQPWFETREELLTEALITFPKDSIALTASVPKKAPITYIPLNDVVTHNILKTLSETVSIVEADWRIVVDELCIKRNIQTVVRRHGDLKNMKQDKVRYETLLQWVKTLEKGTDKWELLSNALITSQNPDVAKLLSNIIAGRPELGRFSKLQDELTPEEEEAKQEAMRLAQEAEDLQNEEDGKGALKLKMKMKKAMFSQNQ